MPPWTEVRRYLRGAWLLARFNTEGLKAFGHGPGDAARSFYAAALVAPMYLLWAKLHGTGLPENAAFLQSAIFETLSYAIGWMIFPLCIWHFSLVVDCRKRFFHFLSAYNWVAVIQNALFMSLDLLLWLGNASEGARAFFGMVLLIYVLAYSTFVARVALALPLGQAIAVVTIDMLTSLAWKFFSQGLAVS